MLADGTVSLAGVVAVCGDYGRAHLSSEFLAVAGITSGRMTRSPAGSGRSRRPLT
ncbi:hypothetical protein [Streptomyces vinaceus]|uniref:hypothetical protein n=1 Tax=Streptomyces vinaceus TaxID=1960 RepID=UPI00380B9DFE